MRTIPDRHVARAVLGAALLLSCVLAIPAPASAAGYARRIAIAPFASLTKEDIGATVSVLPRLLATRLMALAGADVVLLPAGGQSPEMAAKEAKVPLLLQGSVSKLGKGYSVDTIVTDLDTGKTAGAFFSAAATEDDIIAQLGVLSGEIAEKLFGVQGAIRATAPPAPVAASAAPAMIPAYAPTPAATTSLPSYPPSASPAGTAGGTLPPAAAASPLDTGVGASPGWIPSGMKRISESGKIPDELYGVVAGDTDGDGNGDVIAYGRRTIHIHRVKGSEILPYTRIARGVTHHFLNVEAIDIDGDGKKEILVTDLVGDQLESFILKRKGDVYEEVAAKIPYFLVVLPEWMGKPVIAGQHRGFDSPFQGKIFKMVWNGKTLGEGEALPANTNLSPLSSGILGLSSARFGNEWRLLYTDSSERLRIVDTAGKTIYKSGEKYGSATDLFEWGEVIWLEGKRAQFPLKKAARVTQGTEGKPFILIPETKKGSVNRILGTIESSRVVLLQWDGGEFVDKAATVKSDKIYTGADLLSPSGLRKGGKVIASVLVQQGDTFANEESRLILLALE